MNEHQRERDYMVSYLDGYLSAAADVNGAVQEFSMGATLIPLNAANIEAALTRYAENLGWRLTSVTKGARWTEIETWLQTRLLSVPFGANDPQIGESVGDAKRYLAWKATDVAMFLSPEHNPGEIHYLSMERGDAVMMEGCCISYDNDLLVITSVHFPPGFRSSSSS